jgi:hypothetical protein
MLVSLLATGKFNFAFAPLCNFAALSFAAQIWTPRQLRLLKKQVLDGFAG